MRTFLFLLIISFECLVVSCTQPAKGSGSGNSDIEAVMKDSTKFTTIQWQDSAINFGSRKMGEIVNVVFTCTNTGNKPLYLFDVRPGCGCTLVDYTKQPIKPGEQGKIEAKFDTNKSHPGEIHKNISVLSNSRNNISPLLFSGTVVKSDSATTFQKIKDK